MAISWFLYRYWPSYLDFQDYFRESLRDILWVFSELAIIAFILLRKPTDAISVRLYDWTIAILATIGPLFARPDGLEVSYDLGMVLLIAGMFIHIGAKLSLNFSFGIVAANRGVRRNGLYRFVRHPMYFGYVVANSGFLLTSFSLWNVCLYAGVWSLFVLRIFAEEKILSQDLAYQSFQARTKYRLMPGIF